jgi:hypothetical protein
MALTGTMTGALGQIKFAYQTAAVITGFVVARDELTKTWVLTATVLESNAYLLAQTPLVFVPTVKGGAWRWPVESWAMAHGRCTATLAPLPT